MESEEPVVEWEHRGLPEYSSLPLDPPWRIQLAHLKRTGLVGKSSTIAWRGLDILTCAVSLLCLTTCHFDKLFATQTGTQKSWNTAMLDRVGSLFSGAEDYHQQRLDWTARLHAIFAAACSVMCCIVLFGHALKLWVWIKSLVRSAKETDLLPPPTSLQSELVAPFDRAFTLGLRGAVVASCTEVDSMEPLHSNHFDSFHTDRWYLHNVGFPFVFNDFARLAFRRARQAFSFSDQHYIQSMCQAAVRPLGESKGKSGASFYRTHDSRIILKSVNAEEKRMLLHMLPEYVTYCETHPSTLLPRFYGLVSLAIVDDATSDTEQTFVVMANVFETSLPIHKKYDLKGSTKGRSVSVQQRESATDMSDVIYKDLDFKFSGENIALHSTNSKSLLLEQLKHDCTFLESVQVMDYSLLLGVHDPHITAKNCEGTCPLQYTPLDKSRFKHYHGGLRGKKGKVYFVGLIDILQRYNIRKKLETKVKSLVHKSDSISSVPPTFYATRLQKFMDEIIN